MAYMTEVALQICGKRMAILYMGLGDLVIHAEEDKFNFCVSQKKKNSSM